MSITPEQIAGLTASGYKRVIVTRYDGKCEWCAQPTASGVDYAAVNSKGKWQPVCRTCAPSQAAMAGGLVTRIGATESDLTSEQAATLSLTQDVIDVLPEVLGGTADAATGMRVIGSLWRVAHQAENLAKASTPSSDPRIDALREALPRLSSKDASFAESLLGQFDSRGSLSPRQWPWVEKLASKAQTDTVALPDLDNGLYLVDGDVWRLYTTQNGRQGARRLDVDRQTFQFISGGVKVVRTAVAEGTGRVLTGEEAMAMGRQYSFCVCCARDLSDDVSIAMGIGPVCAANLDVPRISEDQAHAILRGDADAATITRNMVTTGSCRSGEEPTGTRHDQHRANND